MVTASMPTRSRQGKSISIALQTYLNGPTAPRRFGAAASALLGHIPDRGDTITIEDALAIVDARGADTTISIFKLIEAGVITADLADRTSGDMTIVLRRLH